MFYGAFTPFSLTSVSCDLQDILAYQRRSTHRLAAGLYLGFLKLSSSVDQIKVLVSQRTPNMLCHTRIRDNANVSRYVTHTRVTHTHVTHTSHTCSSMQTPPPKYLCLWKITPPPIRVFLGVKHSFRPRGGNAALYILDAVLEKLHLLGRKRSFSLNEGLKLREKRWMKTHSVSVFMEIEST